MKLLKPKKLNIGDTVATVSLSWGGAGFLRDRYNIGVKQLEDTFGVNVKEMPHTLDDDNVLYNNPKLRAQDLMDAFLNPDIKAIISCIGGDETIRLLPYIDFDIIKNNPKIFMGFSDTTTNHFMCMHAGLSSFYGPSILTSLAENCGIHEFTRASILKTLFSSEPIGQIIPSSGWTSEMLDWGNPENQKIKRALSNKTEWHFLQGSAMAQGHLIGGCIETMEQLKGTKIWPDLNKFRDSILFFESCSNAAFNSDGLGYWLRNYCATGIMNVVKGIIFGRPYKGTMTNEDFVNFDEIIKTVLSEYGLQDLPVVTRMDFGHTDPMFVIPYGAVAEIDPVNKKFSIIENAVI